MTKIKNKSDLLVFKLYSEEVLNPKYSIRSYCTTDTIKCILVLCL